MKRLVIFRSHLLPISETFIRDQAGALSQWQPVLMGFNDVADGLPTPRIQREIVSEGWNGLVRALRFWLWLGNPVMIKRFKELNISLVHAHFGTSATLIWPSVKATQLPLIVTLHGNDITIKRDWWEAGLGGLRGRVYPRRLLRMAKDPRVSFIAVSEAIRKCAIEYGIPAEKVTVSYIGVDTERFKPGPIPIGERPRRILFIGRMVEKKAPLLMVRAFSEVHKQLADADLVMIGGGPLLGSAQRLAVELKVPVTFLGACTSEVVLKQLHEARVFCLPSIEASNGDAEGLPISIIEAGACGVPIITSARGGAEEGILHGATGYKFSEGDVDGCISALVSILVNADIANDMSMKAFNFVKSKFDIKACTKELEAHYESYT